MSHKLVSKSVCQQEFLSKHPAACGRCPADTAQPLCNRKGFHLASDLGFIWPAMAWGLGDSWGGHRSFFNGTLPKRSGPSPSISENMACRPQVGTSWVQRLARHCERRDNEWEVPGHQSERQVRQETAEAIRIMIPGQEPAKAKVADRTSALLCGLLCRTQFPDTVG